MLVTRVIKTYKYSNVWEKNERGIWALE